VNPAVNGTPSANTGRRAKNIISLGNSKVAKAIADDFNPADAELQGFFYQIWAEGNSKDWLKILTPIDQCTHISKEDRERERRSMSKQVWDREYGCIFDRLESRFFDFDDIEAACG
jgi:hypothetical protein